MSCSSIRHSQLPLCLNVKDGHLQKTQSNLQMGNWRIPGEYFCGKQQRIYFHHCFPFTSLLTTTFQLLCDFANIFSMGALVKEIFITYYNRWFLWVAFTSRDGTLTCNGCTVPRELVLATKNWIKRGEMHPFKNARSHLCQEQRWGTKMTNIYIWYEYKYINYYLKEWKMKNQAWKCWPFFMCAILMKRV